MTIYVSLGKQCHIAMELKKRNLRKFSLPFDWLYIGCFSDIIKLLQNRNEQLFDYKAWERFDEEANQYKNNLLVNLKSRHFFNKDFSNFEEVSKIFRKRTDRLFDVFQSEEEVIFIRDEQWYKLDQEYILKNIRNFCDFFNKNYPKLKWKLILIIDSENDKCLKFHFDYIEKNNIRIVYVHSNSSREWYRPVNPWDFILL